MEIERPQVIMMMVISERKDTTLLSFSVVKANEAPDENEFIDGELDLYRGLTNYLEKKVPRIDMLVRPHDLGIL